MQLTALLFCICAWFLTGRESSFGELFRIDNKYMLLGGILGALITTVLLFIGSALVIYGINYLLKIIFKKINYLFLI